jgi:hypothetical protein
MWVGRDVTTEDVDSLVKYAKRGVLVSDVPVSQPVLDALTALVFAKKPTQDLVDAVYTAFWSTNVVKEWSEDNVVRDENGRFASGGGTAYSDVPKADFKNETTRDAIEWYMNGGSSTLNTALRRPELLPGSGYEQDVERYGSALLDAVNNSSLPEAITVQRMLPLEAVGGDPEELVGRIITDEGFMSTATMRDADGDKVDQWKNYGSGSYNARLVIEVPAGAKALGINTGESEVLLPPNTRVEIFETREVPGGTDLHGRVVLDSPVAKEWNEALYERDEKGRFATKESYPNFDSFASWDEWNEAVTNFRREMYTTVDSNGNPTDPGEKQRGADPEQYKLRDEYVVPDDKTLAMNRALNAGRESSRADRIDNWVNSSTLNKDLIAYRGAALPQEMADALQVGSSFVVGGYQSHAEDEQGARSYLNIRAENSPGVAPVIFKNVIEAGTHAVDAGYGEIVVQRGATVTITGRSEEDGVIYVSGKVSA